MGLLKPLDQIPRDKVVQAIPVIAAINVVKANAAEAVGYDFRVPKESPRNPENAAHLEFESGVLAELKSTNAQDKVVVEADKVLYFRPIRLTKDCLYCHGDPQGSPDAVGGIKEGWKTGEIHGAFEIIFSLDQAKAKVRKATVSVVSWTVGILALIILAAWTMLRSNVIRPLASIQDYARHVAEGDLEAQPKGTFSAELARVKGAIETMVANLKAKMGEAEQKSAEAAREKERAEEALEQAREQETKVSELLAKMTRVAHDAEEISTQVSSAADELSAQIEEVAQGADLQSQRSGETATAMEEMNATVLEVARNSGSSAQSAENARTHAQEGEDIVRQAVEAITRVYQQAQNLKQEMTELGKRADGISQIMVVISDIADQTNLLALNAAIEAARAGEAGRGFAVVADEVRKLAEKTMTATQEVGQAIDAIQQNARANIQSVELAAGSIEQATTLANQSGDALREIVALVNETSDQVRSIATAAEEQSAASDEINRAVDDISRIASETADGMAQSAEAVTELAKLAQQLQELISEMTG